MKYIGLDYGAKRIGVAVSDEEGTIAFPREAVENKPSVFSRIRELCEKERVAGIVVGLPVPFSGGFSAQTKEVERFGEALRAAVAVPVEYQNELFTTKIAGSDQGAAALILQSYLDRQSGKTV